MRPRAALLLGSLCVAPLGCEPVSFFPGGRLGGERVTERITDFAFVGSEYGVQIEARAASLLPSANVRCFLHEGSLYVFAESVVELEWLRALRRDPRARLRVRGKLYDVRAVAVTDPVEIDPLLPTLLRKYFGMEVEGARYVGSSERYPATQVGLNFFRIEPPGGRLSPPSRRPVPQGRDERERRKVPVAMQHLDVVPDGAGGDEAVLRGAHGEARATSIPVQVRGLQEYGLREGRLEDREREHRFPSAAIRALLAKALQHLLDHRQARGDVVEVDDAL